jgi:hypothetical protein
LLPDFLPSAAANDLRFYVNLYTKKSQWDKPTAPALPPDDDGPDGPPPGYAPGSGPAPTDKKTNPYDDPKNQSLGGVSSRQAQEDEDARLARQLQDEEDARARNAGPAGGPGAADAFYNQQSGNPGFQPQGPFPGQQQPPYAGDQGQNRGKGGLLGKLLGKTKLGGSGNQGNYGGNYGGYPPQQQYGGYPQQQYGAPGYGGYGPPPVGYGGGYGGGYQQPPRKQGGGLGTMGGAALGLGAGLIGGALITDAIEDHHDYNEGYQDGYREC